MKGVWHCSMCGETYRSTELRELKAMGEAYIHLGDPEESREIICPDCLDDWDHMTEDEKFDYLTLKGGEQL